MLAVPLSALISGGWMYYQLNFAHQPSETEFRDAIAHMAAINPSSNMAAQAPGMLDAAAKAAAEQLAADTARAASEANAHAAMIVEAHEMETFEPTQRAEPAAKSAAAVRSAARSSTRARRGGPIRYSVSARRLEPEGNETLETLYVDWNDEQRRKTIRKGVASAHQIDVSDDELRPSHRSSLVIQTSDAVR